MKVLFITNLVPYPLDNGGKIKTYNMLKMISVDNEIDLCCFHENNMNNNCINELKKICKNVYSFEKKITTSTNHKYMIKLAIKSIFSFYPLTVLKFEDSRMKKLINDLRKKNNYDVIYIDHLQLSIYLKEGFRELKILDEHNCESMIMKRTFLEEKNILKKIFLGLEYKKLNRFESKQLNKVDKIIVLSKEDRDTLLKISDTKKNKYSIIPIPIECNFYKKSNFIEDKNKVRIMFLGTLSWNPNREAILWFLKNVMPELDNRYELYIVGKDPSKDVLDLSNKFKNVKITGYVNDVNEYIELCDIMIVPIFIGSGLRVKILEALGKGIPVISTNIGAEGIAVNNNKEIIFANNKDEFIKGLIKLEDDNYYLSIKKNGRSLYEKEYSFDAISSKVRYILNKI